MHMEFDAFKLWLVLANLSAANVPYERDEGIGKISNLDTHPGKLRRQRTGLDCSGFVRYVLYQSTFHHVRLNGGSHNQRKWLEKMVFKNYEASSSRSVKDNYAHEAAKIDGCVRIGFRETDFKLKKATKGSSGGQKGVGHVWLVINGKTYESTPKHGRQKGPKSFDWPVRTADVDHFFLLGSAPAFQAHKQAGAHLGWFN